MATKQTLTFVEWDKAISAKLKPALPRTSRTFIKRQVKRAQAGVATIDELALALRIEGKELVVIAAAGQGLKQAAPVIVDFAKRHNLNTIRFHTMRKGLVRFLKPLPFVLIETRKHEFIYRMTV